ncbi:MAG: mechanosensitive ion channel [Clostridiales bacterium]|nr:mechanosensitive ion channel [Clostridiales bacterium]
MNLYQLLTNLATPTLATTVDGSTGEELSKLVKWWNGFYPKAIDFLISLVICFIIYIVGKKIINAILKVVKRAFEKANTEVSAANFVTSLIKAILYSLLFIGIFMKLGVPEASFVALIGSIGLTIGLALQGSLSNFAGGVLILILKPFRIGDFIVVGDKEGTVITIDIIYTKVVTIDNKVIVFPNGTLANANIVNVTDEPTRRLDLIIPIGYNDDIRSVKKELLTICQQTESVLQDQPIDLFVSNYGDDAVEIALRVWVKKEDYFPTKGELLENIKYMFDEKGFTIPFHQLDVSIINQK